MIGRRVGEEGGKEKKYGRGDEVEREEVMRELIPRWEFSEDETRWSRNDRHAGKWDRMGSLGRNELGGKRRGCVLLQTLD